jgi:hypothetical protein
LRSPRRKKKEPNIVRLGADAKKPLDFSRGLGLGREGLGLSDHDFDLIQNASLDPDQRINIAIKRFDQIAENGIGASDDNFHFIFSC